MRNEKRVVSLLLAMFALFSPIPSQAQNAARIEEPSVLIVNAQASARVPETHRFTPKAGYPTFAKRAPVLRIKPGDIVESNTLWGDWYERAGGAWPGEVGPFHIEGATSDDTLVVKIIRVRPNRDTAISTHTPNFSALPTTSTRLSSTIPFRRGALSGKLIVRA